MNVLLAGASGFVGRNLAMALAVHGHHVRPVSRRHGVDLAGRRSPADWRPALDGIDAVVNAVGIIGQTRHQRFETLHLRVPVALFRACAQAGVRRVVQLSAVGADASAFSAYHRSKRAADRALHRLDLDGLVLRPALIYGRGGTSATLLRRLAALPWVPVLAAGPQWVQPVHISDVVATVLQALEGPPARGTLDVVGPQTLRWADWLQALRAAQGLPPARWLPVPYRPALAAAWVAQAWQPLAAPDTLRMLRAGYRADGLAVQRFLGRALRWPEPRLHDEDASVLWSRP
ncbi:MAG: NAD(P)H-binding protein [Burkholderiales bacterium]|nr:NAD(P)H-binding protein [Burkholderiales bacterium]